MNPLQARRARNAVIVVAASVLLLTSPALALELGEVTTGAGVGIGARALAMGGAYTAMAEDATALYWCPAGLAYADGFHVVATAGGRATNIDVADDLKDLADILEDNRKLTTDDVLTLIRIARRANHKPVVANVGALAGIQGGQWALGTWGRGQATVELDWNEVIGGVDVWAGAAGNPRTEPARMAAAASWGAGYGWKLNDRTAVGVVVRQMRVGYRQARAEGHVSLMAGGSWKVSTESEVTEEFEDDDDAMTADVGLMYHPEPRVRFAVTVRNILGPDFHLQDRDRATGEIRRITVKTQPSVDLGMAVWSGDGDLAVALDIHNVTGSDGARPSAHVGLRYRCSRWLTLMAGGSHWGPTFGVDLRLGPLTVVAATGEDWKTLAAARLELRF